MAAIPLRWLGTSRRKALQAWVEACCAQWSRAWSVVGDGMAVDVLALHEACEHRHPFDPRWHVLREHAGVVHLKASAAMFERIGCALADIADADTCGIAAGIGRRAMTDLAAVLLQSPTRADFTALPGPPDAAWTDARHGAMGFRCALGAADVELYLDAAACDAIAPPSPRPPIALTSRRAAIRPAAATFEVVLDLGRVSLLESIALKPGEIVKTSVPIDAAIQARTPTGAPLFEGALVAAERHRAIRLSAHPHKRESNR